MGRDHEAFAAVQSGDAARLRELLAADEAAVCAARSAKGGFTPLIAAAQAGEDECALLLLEAGARVTDRSTDGRSALHYAVAGGHDIAASYLLRYGASLTRGDERGDTPLHWGAQLATPEALSVAQLLLSPEDHAEPPEGSGKRGSHVVTDADVAQALTARNHRGELALHFAACEPDAEKLAVWMIATAVRTLPKGGTAAWLRTQGDSGTPLHAACSTGNSRLAVQMLGAGADPAAVANDGTTPLHCAVLEGSLDLVEVLLNASEDASFVNHPDGNGVTVLHHAARGGRLEILQRLLRCEGVQCDTVDSSGRRPIQLAHAKGHDRCVAHLAAAGATTGDLGTAGRGREKPRDVQRQSGRGQELAEEEARKRRREQEQEAEKRRRGALQGRAAGGSLALYGALAALALAMVLAWLLRG